MLRRLLGSSIVKGVSPIVFVDVGAAGGVEPPWDRLVASPVGKVVGFEPNPNNLKAIARVPNGDYHQIAISNKPGTIKFFLAGTKSSIVDRSATIGRPLESIEVEADSLENLRNKGVIPSIDILKSDAELFDYEVVESAGKYLDTEVLAVQAEFAMHASESERGLDALLSLLSGRFKLVELSLKRDRDGAIQGGDLLFIRVPDVDMQVERLIKLLVVASAINNTRYADLVLDLLEKKVDPPSFENLERAARATYLPDLLPGTGIGLKLATFFGMISQLCAGRYWIAKSAFTDNRLRRLPILMVRRHHRWRKR